MMGKYVDLVKRIEAKRVGAVSPKNSESIRVSFDSLHIVFDRRFNKTQHAQDLELALKAVLQGEVS